MKRGPVGVILNTMNDAFETADNIAADIESGEDDDDNTRTTLNKIVIECIPFSRKDSTLT